MISFSRQHQDEIAGVYTYPTHAHATTMTTQVDTVLADALYHVDHLPDFAAAFGTGDAQNQRAAVASYPRQLFDQLRALVCGSTYCSR